MGEIRQRKTGDDLPADQRARSADPMVIPRTTNDAGGGPFDVAAVV